MTSPPPFHPVFAPGRLARVHAAAFRESGETAWDAKVLHGLLAMPGVFLEEDADGHGGDAEPEGGFILCRMAADEAEILTLAVAPGSRRRGLGGRLLDRAATRASALGAATLFLEVASDNTAALALYRSRGFVEKGQRPAYYARRDGSRADALILALNLAPRLS